MKLRKVSGRASLIILACIIVTSLVIAQEKKETSDDGITKLPDGSYKSKEHDESNRPDDSYIAKFHATDIVNKLMKRNLDQLYMLKVIVSNYTDKGWKAEYDKLYEGYKDGMSQYYKRNLIYSRLKLEKNKKEIFELYKKVIVEYQKEAEAMLSECASKVLAIHMDVSSRTDPNRFDALYQNHMRLRIAYSHLDESVEATNNHYYMGAVYHLRVSKSYAVSILEDLAKPDEKKSVSDKYKVVKADNLNRIFSQKAAEEKK